MGEELVERPLMNTGEFASYINKNKVNIVDDFYDKGILHLKTFEAVKKFKSVRRAIRRGHVSLDGVIYPKRPFNNSKSKKGSLNDRKKIIYGRIKNRLANK